MTTELDRIIDSNPRTRENKAYWKGLARVPNEVLNILVLDHLKEELNLGKELELLDEELRDLFDVIVTHSDGRPNDESYQAIDKLSGHLQLQDDYLVDVFNVHSNDIDHGIRDAIQFPDNPTSNHPEGVVYAAHHFTRALILHDILFKLHNISRKIHDILPEQPDHKAESLMELYTIATYWVPSQPLEDFIGEDSYLTVFGQIRKIETAMPMIADSLGENSCFNLKKIASAFSQKSAAIATAMTAGCQRTASRLNRQDMQQALSMPSASVPTAIGLTS